MTETMASVGWQGITLKAPADWSLVGVSGDERKGYFRVDSPVASAIEVRWSATSGKVPDLMTKGREFLSGLEKSCRKNRVKFSSKIKEDPGESHSVSFTWRADRLGQGRLIYCEKCQRVIIAQVISARDEAVSRIAPAMLGSIVDHRDDGWVNWALYGLEFAVPESYKIEKQKLMSGYLSLSFKGRGKMLVVERWGLASTLLEGDELREWFRKDVLPDIKGFHVDLTEGEISGHEAIILEGRRSGIAQAVKTLVHSVTLHPHPGRISGCAWHCVETNRLFSVRATHATDDDVADRVRDSIICHR